MPNNEIKTRYMCFLFVLFGFFLLLLFLLFLVCWQFMWQASLSGIELRLRDIVEFSGTPGTELWIARDSLLVGPLWGPYLANASLRLSFIYGSAFLSNGCCCSSASRDSSLISCRTAGGNRIWLRFQCWLMTCASISSTRLSSVQLGCALIAS